MRPLILTNAFRRPRGTRSGKEVNVSETSDVYACIEELVDVITGPLGAVPLMLPTVPDEETMAALLDLVDGILLPGAVSNIDPASYGEAAVPGQMFDAVHDRVDFFLIAEARRRGLPFLGLCRAMQAMNIVFGGTLVQSIPSGGIDHQCSYPCEGMSSKPEFMHSIDLPDEGMLAKLLGTSSVMINSLHEQAIGRLGSGLAAEAISPDGVIEAISWPGAPFFLGVQWHPEAMPDHPVSYALFSGFQAAVQARFRHAATLVSIAY
jgi:putative glutamine amidotransferase